MKNVLKHFGFRGSRVVALAGALIVGALLSTMWASPAYAQRGVLIHATADVNVRACPSTDCRILGVLRKGRCEQGERRVAGGSWVRINYQGMRGFVATRYLNFGCRRGRG